MTLLILDGDPLLFRSAFNTDSLEHAYERYEEKLEEIENSTFCDDTVMAVFGDNNFRIDFDPEYKNTPGRKKSKLNNPHYFELRLKLIEAGIAIPSHGMEADDLVRIWAEEAMQRKQQFVVASVDKDLQCIAGHHYLIHRGELIYVDENTADLHYWTQVITGDMVDNIRGIYGVGPKKAAKFLDGANTRQERKQRVIDTYYSFFGDDWKKEMMHTGTLIHIMRTPTDMFALKDTDLPVNPELIDTIRAGKKGKKK